MKYKQELFLVSWFFLLNQLKCGLSFLAPKLKVPKESIWKSWHLQASFYENHHLLSSHCLLGSGTQEGGVLARLQTLAGVRMRMESRGGQAGHWLPVPRQSLGPGAMCRAVQHRGLASSRRAVGACPSVRSSSQLISFVTSGGGGARNSNFYSHLFSEYNSQVLMCVPGALLPALLGHLGSTVAARHPGNMRKAQSSPCRTGIGIFPTCVVAPGSLRVLEAVVMPMWLENSSQVRKSCSEGLGGSCRAEAAGGAPPGGGSCGWDPI